MTHNCRYCGTLVWKLGRVNHGPTCPYYEKPKSDEEVNREKMEEQKRLPFLNEEGWDL